MTLFRFILAIFSILLSACQTTHTLPVTHAVEFHDELFPDSKNITIETEQQIFYLGPKAKQFVDNNLNRVFTYDKRIRTLVDSIFDHSNLGLLYANGANTVAEETFLNQSANCLSLVIMTYAMADYAQIGVQFQHVKTPELWVRREGNNILNGHVNLRLYPKTSNNVILYEKVSYQLDFDPRSQRLHYPVSVIEKPRVLAMFYNNKGVDALIKKDYNRAYAYLKRSLMTDPQLVEAWTNIGVLYRRNQRLDYAESAYQNALKIDDGDAPALENLAHIYKMTSREELAEPILATLKRKRRDNPYYHYLLGETEYEAGNWEQAIKYYRRSIRLEKQQHQFYFSLAKSYYQLGDIENTKRYFKMAKRYADKFGAENGYQSKIDALVSMH